MFKKLTASLNNTHKIEYNDVNNKLFNIRTNREKQQPSVNPIKEVKPITEVKPSTEEHLFMPEIEEVRNTTHQSIKIIDIFATKFIENIANALANILRECGIIVFTNIRNLDNLDIKICRADETRFLFIFCPQTMLQAKNGPLYPTSLEPLPENKYFLYQLEQLDIGSGKNINDNLINLIKYSKHAFDYSEVNLAYYPEEIRYKVSYLMPPVVHEPIVEYYSTIEKKYDILFCGYINPRRDTILNHLKLAGYNVLSVTKVFGTDLTKLIKQSRIFLNIHYNNSSRSLETCRLNEAVMVEDTYIISENVDGDHLYRDRVIFVDKENILKTVKELLDVNNKYNKKSYFDIEEFCKNYKKHLWYFYREPITVICNNFGGGSIKFINDISIYYKVHINFIKSKKELLTLNISENTIIIIQSFLFTDFDIDTIVDTYNKYNCKIILPIHEWYWFVEPYISTYDFIVHYKYLYDIKLNESSKKLFSVCDKIICPSQFVYDIINNMYSVKIENLQLQEWLDYDYKNYINNVPNVPLIFDNTINIGVLHEYNKYKGKELIEYLTKNHVYYSKYKITYFISGYNIPKYNEVDFFKQIETYHIHGLLHLNKWGETYCYSLTKSLMSGLPILYNNIGSFKYRIPNFDKFIINCSNEDQYNNKSILDINFKKLMEYVINNNGTYKKKLPNFNLKSNTLFDNIFNVSIKKIKKIKKYAVYFPQFHEFKENNILFYKGFTDIVNLYKLNNNTKETPNLNLLGLKEFTGYDIVKHNPLMDNQFNLLDTYNIDGFAVYYYWFNINTITDNKKIMYDAIHKLLNSCKHGKKIFYIWANESWSDNDAFGLCNEFIQNTYNNFQDLCDDLIKDFKHINYLKINNKPVFYIHHPWLITSDKLDIFKTLINSECIKNGFSGIIFKLNSMNESETLIKARKNDYYDFHPNYKKTVSNKYIDEQIIMDYESYINNDINSITNVQTIFFDFDNRARLCCPNRLDKSIFCINNNHNNFIKYITKINEHFIDMKYDDESMILINAWNEWGEKMHIEPSEQKKTYYLQLINSNFI